MDGIWPPPPSPELYQIKHYRGQENTGTWVIEGTEFKFEIRSDLGGHREAAIIMAVPGNMHIGVRVIEVAIITS